MTVNSTSVFLWAPPPATVGPRKPLAPRDIENARSGRFDGAWPADGSVLSICGELDAASGSFLEVAAAFLIERGATAVRIDMTNITFMDCAGWCAVEQLQRALSSRDIRSTVLNISPAAQRLLDLAGLALSSPKLCVAAAVRLPA